MKVFSFIKQPIVHLLEISNDVIAGIDKAVAIYYDDLSRSIKGNIMHPNISNSIDELFLNDYSLIDKLRMQQTPYSWQTSSNLPFETTNEHKVQLNIFDEYENVVLCLGFSNPIDNKKDLLFLYLNKNKANFGVANTDVPLSTNEKNIIAQIAYNSLQVIYKQQITDREILFNTNKRIIGLKQENENLHSEIDRLKNENRNSKLKIVEDKLETLSKQLNIRFSLDDSAIEKINQYKGSFNALGLHIEQSAINAVNTQFGLHNNHIELSGWDIEFESITESNINLNNTISERYQKTLQLLDKLEGAAKTVLESNKKLTSENVGGACPIPISAPAISDALKNHHKKVRSLLNEYPDRWPIIKNEFRPVKNILLSFTG